MTRYKNINLHHNYVFPNSLFVEIYNNIYKHKHYTETV